MKPISVTERPQGLSKPFSTRKILTNLREEALRCLVNHLRASPVVFVCAVLACGILTPAVAATVELGEYPAAALPAGQFIEGAIAAEGRADRVDRDRLIVQALQADADFAPAHWLAGQIRYAGQWMTVDAALEKGAA